MKNMIRILGLTLCITFFCIIFYYAYHHSRWESYFKKKLTEKPRSFVIDGLRYVPNPVNTELALDLGAGVGHETLLLLRKGFHVIAVDSQPKAFTYMQQLSGIKQYLHHLTPIVSTFEKLDFQKIPPLSVIIASFSLPFCKPQTFNSVWRALTNTIKPHGYFIGNFFDPRFNVFKANDRKNMSFHTKEQVLELFKDFSIIAFNEVNIPGDSLGQQDYYYTVIAQKI